MPALSDPFSARGLELRNRLVMAPMVTGLAADHAPGDAMVAWYRARARAGVGLVIVEACAVAPDALVLPRTLGLWDDAQVSGLASLAEAIHAEGARAVLQLVHAGGRAWRGDLGGERVAPSAVPLVPGPPPRPLSEEEILALARTFGAAAARARAAGFDGVELHAAHYYLLSQFLSPWTNRRSDRWGGDARGRAAFGVEVTRAVRGAVGPDAALLCRMHGTELFPEGMSDEDAAHAARAFRDAGVDVLHASGVTSASRGEWQGQSYLQPSSIPPKRDRSGAYAAGAGRLREATGLPVIAVGKLAEPGSARQVLDRGLADLVAVGRQLIADPETPAKLLAGRDDEIARCQECLTCFAAIRKGPVKCGVNQAL